MLRSALVAVMVVCALIVTSCVVVRRETPTSLEPPSGEPGRGGDTEPPQADPQPLEASSDRAPLGGLGWALLSPEVPTVALEVVAATREHRDRSSGDGTVGLHMLVLPGRFEAEGVPGVAFHATAFAVFPEVIAGMLPAGAEVDQFEAAVAVHELGHTFGLVNVTGVGGFHESPDHPRHSPDEDSVMYWAIESSSLAQIFRTGPPSTFNPDDGREMSRIRGLHP